MIEVMGTHYASRRVVEGRQHGAYRSGTHALRNALITPVTVIMLQFLATLGVIVVEVFYAYKGFGTLLYDAALNSDIRLGRSRAMVRSSSSSRRRSSPTSPARGPIRVSRCSMQPRDGSEGAMRKL